MKRIIIATLLFVAAQGVTAQPIVSSPENRVSAITGSALEIPKDGTRIDGWTATNAYWASPLIYRSQRFPEDGTGNFPFNQYGELMIQGTSSGSAYNKGISFLTWDGTSSPASLRMRITNNGNVGIGTTTPDKKLHINSGTVNTGIRVESTDADAIIEFRDNSSSTLGSAYVGARGDDIIVGQLADIRMSINADGNIGIGTTDPKSKLAVEGEVRATRVKVLDDISVPDYVFEENYELRTLEETKAYITANKHLPEIPSAAEIGKEGIDLGDMNMRLLKKIEELTLYQIELMEEMREMKKELGKLK